MPSIRLPIDFPTNCAQQESNTLRYFANHNHPIHHRHHKLCAMSKKKPFFHFSNYIKNFRFCDPPHFCISHIYPAPSFFHPQKPEILFTRFFIQIDPISTNLFIVLSFFPLPSRRLFSLAHNLFLYTTTVSQYIYILNSIFNPPFTSTTSSNKHSWPVPRYSSRCLYNTYTIENILDRIV